jgi:hypothetical protein
MIVKELAMRRARPLRGLIIFGAAACIGAGVLVADKLLSRRDRIHWDRCVVDLKTVRDAVLRYEYRKGALPEALAELAPAYLRADQLEAKDGSVYDYRRSERRLAMGRDVRIRGLWPRTRKALVFDLPWPDGPSSAPASNPSTSSEAPAPEAFSTTNTVTDVPPIVGSVVKSREPGMALSERVLQAERAWTNTTRTARLQAPRGPVGQEPPKGAYVFEAEHWSSMNYAWEIFQNPGLAGGAGIVCKEGTTTGSAQCYFRTYDFYNVREQKLQSVLRYYFYLPQGGRFRIGARFWATCTHCSNTINVGLDRGGLDIDDPRKVYYGVFLGSGVPFRWRWVFTHRTFYLKPGMHYLQVFPHEDGMEIDQFMLYPARQDCRLATDEVFVPNLPINKNTTFAAEAAYPVHLSFSLKSMVIGKTMPANAKLAIRRLRESAGVARIVLRLEAAGPHGQDLVLGHNEVELADLPELSFLPVDFSELDYDRLARREYLLVAEMEHPEAGSHTCHIPLMHPPLWEVSPMMTYYSNETGGPLDGDGSRDEQGREVVWQPFEDRSWTPLGIMDFGVHTVSNSLHAPAMKTIYARTWMEAPRSGHYLLKAQSDDQMRVWVDGEPFAEISSTHSVIRNSHRFKVYLEKGRHRLRIRVNQGPHVKKLDGGYWQASLRFRTLEDELSDVRWTAR